MLVRYPGQQQLAELNFAVNTPEVGLLSNVEINARRALPVVGSFAATEQPAVVIGGGPSLASTLELIAEMKRRGAKLFALNNAAKFMHEHGISADVQIILDPRPVDIAFLEKRWCDEVLLASQCDPSLFDHCEKIGYPVRIWHPLIDNITEKIPYPQPVLVGGGLTVGLSGLCLIYTLGHRDLHLFGYDSCHAENKSHAYEQKIETPEMVRVCVEGRVFNCSLMMAGQAHAFQQVAQMLAENGCDITVHGDGLIPHLVKVWQERDAEKVLTAVYDLGVSPPTYDFFSFLSQADLYAKENGFTHIDLVFEPGPMNGFRDDELPPDAIAREGMLRRVCVEGAWLCPRVRNVTVLKRRKEITGDVFPVGWKDEYPIAHYGFQYSINANRCLRASEGAKREIARLFKKPYATITLREAEYWPARNSNKLAAYDAALWLRCRHIEPIIVPDTHGKPLLGIHAFAQAAWDIDLRLALYEGALMNIGTVNGPTTGLWTLSDVPYIAFKPIADGSNASSKEWFENHDAYLKDWSPNGHIVWADDTPENVIQALNEILTEKTSCQM